MDGAGVLLVFWQITLPLAGPAGPVVILFSHVWTGNGGFVPFLAQRIESELAGVLIMSIPSGTSP